MALFASRYRRPQNYPVENQCLQRLGNEYLRVAVASMQGFRDDMEDAHSAVLSLEKHKDCSFFAVFDGHNGRRTSTWCAEHLSKSLDELNEFTEETVRHKFIELDKQYLDSTNDKANGTTAVFAILQKLNSDTSYEPSYPATPENGESCQTKKAKFKVTVGNLGDSRCFVGHYKSPQFAVLTSDHKPSLPDEEARIKSAGGFVARGRVDACLAVSRAFGDGSYKTNTQLTPDKQKVVAVPDVTEVYLTEDDFLFLCCDGIFETFTNEGTIKYIHEALKAPDPEPAKILSDLLYKIMTRGSRDNMTAILVEFKDGSNYNQSDEFVVGEWYKHGNDTYIEAFESNCQRYGKTVEEVRAMWLVKKKANLTPKKSDNDGSDDSTSSSDSSDEDEPIRSPTQAKLDDTDDKLEKDSIIGLSGRGRRGIGLLGGVRNLHSDNSLMTQLQRGAGSDSRGDGVKQTQSERTLAAHHQTKKFNMQVIGENSDSEVGAGSSSDGAGVDSSSDGVCRSSDTSSTSHPPSSSQSSHT